MFRRRTPTEAEERAAAERAAAAEAEAQAAAQAEEEYRPALAMETLFPPAEQEEAQEEAEEGEEALAYAEGGVEIAPDEGAEAPGDLGVVGAGEVEEAAPALPLAAQPEVAPAAAAGPSAAQVAAPSALPAPATRTRVTTPVAAAAGPAEMAAAARIAIAAPSAAVAPRVARTDVARRLAAPAPLAAPTMQVAGASMITPTEGVPLRTTAEIRTHAVPDQVLALRVPDLINGLAEEIVQTVLRGTLDERWRFCFVEGLSPADYTRAIPYMVRSAYAYLCEPGDTPAVRASKRKQAYLLGTVRSFMVAAWGLTAAMMVPTEVLPPLYAFQAAAARAGRPTAEGGQVAVVRGAAPERVAYANEMADLTDAEWAFVGHLAKYAYGVPVANGISLVLTQHHVLPTTERIFAAMERQMSQEASPDAYRTMVADVAEWSHILRHHAAHPIAVELKMRWASDPAVKARLISAGATAAVVRAPPRVGAIAAATSLLAFAQQVRPVWTRLGGEIDLAGLAAAISAVESAPDMTTRRTAEATLEARVTACSAFGAQFFGMFRAMCERADQTGHTLLRSYAVRRMSANNVAATNVGVDYFKAYAQRAKAAAEAEDERPVTGKVSL